eukprot:jgi/Mesen1/10585/ME000085S09911
MAAIQLSAPILGSISSVFSSKTAASVCRTGLGRTPVTQSLVCRRMGFSSSSLVCNRLPAVKPAVVNSESVKSSVSVTAASGYKLKTHKASAKRFRVTGTGKIVRRNAWRQHLLRKKTTTRKNRLAGLKGIDRSNIDNVVGALPYLKVMRRRD